MPSFPPRLACLALGLAACAAVAGCSGFNNATQRFAGALTPYKVQVVQGNFISREQVESLQPGMSRQQVRDALGTPLVASVFHADRWDYVFTLKRQGADTQSRHLTVYFKGDVLERFEGDTMPTESEFVATLDVKRKRNATPVLEASEDQIKRFGGAASASQPTAEPPAPLERNYPPLEPPAGR